MGNSNRNSNIVGRIWTISKQPRASRIVTSGEYSITGGRAVFVQENTIRKHNPVNKADIAFLR
eukprot:3684192-Ditylum_brightwellii.AAC.1